MGLIARVKQYSRHDTIIAFDKRFTKDKWTKIDKGLVHEELTIIDEKAIKPKKKKEVRNDHKFSRPTK